MARVTFFGSSSLQNPERRLRVRPHRDTEGVRDPARGDREDAVQRRAARGNALLRSRELHDDPAVVAAHRESVRLLQGENDACSRLLARLRGNLDAADELVVKVLIGGPDGAAGAGDVDGEAPASDDEVLVGEIGVAADDDLRARRCP